MIEVDKTKLGNRIKEFYENRSKTYLTRRQPVVIRIDGKTFSTFTKGLEKPFDNLLIETMQETAKYLCENIQGCKLAYTQSDEISLLLTDYDKLTTDAWFGYGVQKMVSISASMATLAFNSAFVQKIQEYADKMEKEGYPTEDIILSDRIQILTNKINKALFDSRVFSIPKEEVNNYFLWRQQDATKNSITMLAQSKFSHKGLQGKNGSQKQDMLMEKYNINWNDLPTTQKRGSCVIKAQSENKVRKKWVIDNEIPIFSKDIKYVESLVYIS